MIRRFIGGPLHGEIRALREDNFGIRVPMHDYSPMIADTMLAASSFRIREVEYRREQIAFGQNCRISVMVDTRLSEDAKWRKIADLVEGVDDTARR